jgi:hypothetical protein
MMVGMEYGKKTGHCNKINIIPDLIRNSLPCLQKAYTALYFF